MTTGSADQHAVRASSLLRSGVSRKFMLVGLPRSGTTILSNYIHSAPDGFCFVEPHWQYAQYADTSFLADQKLRGMFFLRYKADARLPLDKALARILKRYRYAGFKETFRSNVYGRYAPTLPNVGLLTSYRDAGYVLIPVLRDPRDIWNSFQRHEQEKGAWTSDLEAFLVCYAEFLRFMGDVQPIVYERFVADPQGEWNAVAGFDLGPPAAVAPRSSRMGDRDANKSSEIKAVERPLYYSAQQREAIEGSEAMAGYQALLKR